MDLPTKVCEHNRRNFTIMTQQDDVVQQGSSTICVAVDGRNVHIKPWLAATAGQQYACRTRSPDRPPNLLSGLLFISELLRLLLLPPLEADALFDELQLELLRLLEAQMPGGPWGHLLVAHAKVGGWVGGKGGREGEGGREHVSEASDPAQWFDFPACICCLAANAPHIVLSVCICLHGLIHRFLSV